MQHVIVAQKIKGGRAPAELTRWHRRLLDELPASAGMRVLLVAAMVAVAGVIVAMILVGLVAAAGPAAAGGKPTPLAGGRPSPASAVV